MKKLLMLFALVGFVGFASVSAQECPYSKAKKTEGTAKVHAESAAAKAASMDDSVEKRVCEKSGQVSYVRKSVCEKSGNVSYSDVEYCSKSGKFVNVSPSAKKNCAKTCTKGAKATKTATTAKACTKKAGSKACCKSKAKGASAKKACTKSAKAMAAPAKGQAKFINNTEDDQ